MSGSGGSAGDATAKLSADVAAFIAAMRQAGAAAATMGAQTATGAAAASAALGTVTTAAAESAAAVESLGVQAAATTGVFNTLGVSAGFVGQKMAALIDESLAGRWRQAEGSLANLVFRMAEANPVATALGVAILATGAAAGYAAYQWYENGKAIEQATGEMIQAGSASDTSAAQIKDSMEQMRSVWGDSQSEARKTAIALGALAGAAAPFAQQLEVIANAQAKLDDSSEVSKYADAIAHKFNEGGRGALEWAQSLDLLHGKQLEDAEAAEKAGQNTEVMALVIDAANDRFATQTQRVELATKKLKDWNAELNAASEAGAAIPDNFPPEPPKPQDLHQPQHNPTDQQAADDQRSEDKLNETYQRRETILDELAAAERRLRASTDPQDIIAAQNAIAVAQQQLAETHDQLQQNAHNKTMGQLQEELAAERDHADARVGILKQIAQEEANYYGSQSAQARAAQERYVDGQRTAADTALRIHLEELQGEQDADRNNVSAQIAIQQEKLQALRAADKQDTAEYQTTVNELLNLQREAGDKAVQVKINELRQKQDASEHNYAEQLQLEDKILAMVVAHYGAQSTEYQAEADKRAEIARREKEQEEQQAEEMAAVVKSVYESVNTAVAATNKGGKGNGGSALLQILGVDDDQVEQAHAKLAELTAAYQQTSAQLQEAQQQAQGDPTATQKVLDEEIEANFKYASDVVQAQEQAAEATRKAWQTAADSITGELNSNIAKIVTGYETVRQAVRTIATDVAQHMIESSLQAAEHWVEDRLYEAVFTSTTETAKTAATNLGNIARQGSNVAATTAAGTQQLLQASQVAVAQTQMTATTVAGTTARVAATTAGANTQLTVQQTATAEGKAVESTANVASVQGSAAKAAAGAYSAVAGIPYVGPFLAPPAAAVAYAAVMAFDSLASLDVGAWNVPQDMVAQIHKGESVVPTTFAEGLRDGTFGNLAQSASQSISFSPTIHNYGVSGSGATNSSINNTLHRAQRQLMSHLWDVTRNGSLAVRTRY